MFNSTFKRKKSALKTSIVKFSFYCVCGININWFSTNAFFFIFNALFSTENTRFYELSAAQNLLCKLAEGTLNEPSANLHK